jgi:hypothetical protein
METTFPAFFDGQVLKPDEPPKLTPNRRYIVTVAAPTEATEPNQATYPLTELLALATDMGHTDLAERHDDYAHPGPEPERHEP